MKQLMNPAPRVPRDQKLPAPAVLRPDAVKRAFLIRLRSGSMSRPENRTRQAQVFQGFWRTYPVSIEIFRLSSGESAGKDHRQIPKRFAYPIVTARARLAPELQTSAATRIARRRGLQAGRAQAVGPGFAA